MAMTLGPAISLGTAGGYGLPVGTYTFPISFLSANGIVVETVASSGLHTLYVYLEANGPKCGRKVIPR